MTDERADPLPTSISDASGSFVAREQPPPDVQNSEGLEAPSVYGTVVPDRLECQLAKNRLSTQYTKAPTFAVG